MDIDINNRNFPDTGIKTPAEKTRAMAIITAKDDASGLNKINFSISAFLQKGALKDICYIMGQWATEPVRRSPGKFIRFPAAGKEALITRADALLKHLQQRRDMTAPHLLSLETYMHNAINHEITYLGSNDQETLPQKSA
ncbi:MAG: hypothetical protein KAJ29_07540 [Alphaproteobacteria bacterium]|nr:hypothetical protein [Alphaproteobacteria bacterium]